jgi:predicted DNA-binding WGR domain protein
MQFERAISPVIEYLVLRRVDPEHAVARYYSLLVERDLFDNIVLVRQWGRIGTQGRELVEEHASLDDALKAMDALAQAKRRRGYQDL